MTGPRDTISVRIDPASDIGLVHDDDAGLSVQITTDETYTDGAGQLRDVVPVRVVETDQYVSSGGWLYDSIPAAIGGGPPPTGDYLLTEGGDRLTLEDGTPIEVTGTITGLPVATDLDGTEWAVMVQAGVTVRVRTRDLAYG